MEPKTNVTAEEGKQYLEITREFDIPLELLFKAYTEPEIVEQWMGTKVLRLENEKFGGYRFETSGPNGNVVVKMNGTIHEFLPGQRIIRTFEMENMSFGVQLEFLEFERLTDSTSKLSIKSIYKSVEARNEQLKLPFSYGINMAHNRLEEVMNNLK